jgi:hypothetical protein
MPDDRRGSTSAPAKTVRRPPTSTPRWPDAQSSERWPLGTSPPCPSDRCAGARPSHYIRAGHSLSSTPFKRWCRGVAWGCLAWLLADGTRSPQLQPKQNSTGEGIPNLGCSVPRSGDDARGVGTELSALDCLFMLQKDVPWQEKTALRHG